MIYKRQIDEGMKLWLLTHQGDGNHISLDRVVVVAVDVVDALSFSFVEGGIYVEYPCGDPVPAWRHYYYNDMHDDSWTESPKVEFLADNAKHEEGVICTSRTMF